MFSFKNRQKKFMPVELEDGTVIHLKSPRLDTMQELLRMANGMGDANEFDTLIKMVPKLLNGNLEGKKFTVADVSRMFDQEDLMDFLAEYMAFVQGTQNEKN